MIKPSWRKVWGDLRQHPAKASMLVCAMCVAVSVVSGTFAAQVTLEEKISRSYDMAHVPHGVAGVQKVSLQLTEALAAELPDARLSSRRMVRVRVRLNDGQWRVLKLYTIPDFERLQVSSVYPLSGAWPPDPGSVLLERSGLSVLDASLGEDIEVRVPGSPRTSSLKVSGIVHDLGPGHGWARCRGDHGAASLVGDDA